jgi:hypothetical protein
MPQGPLRRRIAHYIKTGEILPETIFSPDHSAHDARAGSGVGHTAPQPAHLRDRVGAPSRLPAHLDAELEELRRQNSATPFDAEREAAAEHAKTKALERAPIWASSVVPAGEDNSRVLNMMRVHEDDENGLDDITTMDPRALIRAIGIRPTPASVLRRGRVARSMVPATTATSAPPVLPTSAPPRVANGRARGLYNFAPASAASTAVAAAAYRAPRRAAPLVSTRTKTSPAVAAENVPPQSAPRPASELNARRASTSLLRR